ncbi:MAG: hypothetical protein ACOCQG_00710 [Candidatus Nanoarchaeia archaeon]
MDTKGDAKNLIIILFIALFLSSAIVAYNFKQQKEIVEDNFTEFRKDAFEQFDKMNNTINKLHEINSEHKNELEQLESKYQTTYQNYIQLNQSYTEMSEANVELIEDLEEAFEKINTFREDINSSLEWFKHNSKLKDTPQIKDDLSSSCIENCTINLACIHFVNEQSGFTYNPDIQTSGEIDQLQSLEDFRDNMGGDCEDFSLFFKAQYNYLKEKCGKVTLKTYEQKDGAGRFFLDFDNKWYIENAKKIELDKNSWHANIFCGKMYDYREDSTTGHCIVGFTQTKLESPETLKEIETAELLEPQNGMHYGKLNDESSGLYLLKKGEKPETFVNLIISDTDMFLYSESEQKWLSYSYFDKKLASLEQRKK